MSSPAVVVRSIGNGRCLIDDSPDESLISIALANDKSKIPLIYAQMHHFSLINADKAINFTVETENEADLEEIHNFFNKNPELIPAKVNLTLKNTALEQKPTISEIKGRGIIDEKADENANVLRAFIAKKKDSIEIKTQIQRHCRQQRLEKAQKSSRQRSPRELNRAYVQHFREHLLPFLKGEHQPNPHEKNQPTSILEKSISTVGKLSRIFDAFTGLPTISDEQAKEMDPVDLRIHIDDLLKDVGPLLLNEDKTALHPQIIEALGQRYDSLIYGVAEKMRQAEAGVEDKDVDKLRQKRRNDNPYFEQLKKRAATEVAKQFMQGVIVSYGQRIVDGVPKIPKDFLNNPALFDEEERALHQSSYNRSVVANEGVITQLGNLAATTTQDGLAKESIPIDENAFNEAIEEMKSLSNDISTMLESNLSNEISTKFKSIKNKLDEVDLWLEMRNFENANKVFHEASVLMRDLLSHGNGINDKKSDFNARLDAIHLGLQQSSEVKYYARKKPIASLFLGKSAAAARAKVTEEQAGLNTKNSQKNVVEEIRYNQQDIAMLENKAECIATADAVSVDLRLLNAGLRDLEKIGTEEDKAELVRLCMRYCQNIVRDLTVLYQLHGALDNPIVNIQQLNELEKISQMLNDENNLQDSLGDLLQFTEENKQTLTKMSIGRTPLHFLGEHIKVLDNQTNQPGNQSPVTVAVDFEKIDTSEEKLQAIYGEILHVENEIRNFKCVTVNGRELVSLAELGDELEIEDRTRQNLILQLDSFPQETQMANRAKVEHSLDDTTARQVHISRAMTRLTQLFEKKAYLEEQKCSVTEALTKVKEDTQADKFSCFKDKFQSTLSNSPGNIEQKQNTPSDESKDDIGFTTSFSGG